jgi:uncharacterized protein (DUF1501 family)
MTMPDKFSRRRFVSLASAGGAVLIAPRLTFASAGTDQRFVFFILRGAADGLEMVIPYADPNYERARGALAVSADKATKLNETFALHPALAQTAAMYAEGEALFVHAVASSFRDRSHFDAQNILETGGKTPYAQRDGWLNRLAAMLPSPPAAPIAFGSTIPAALRGPLEVNSYAPSNLPEASDDLYARVTMLYEQDAQLHKLWTAAMQTRSMAEGAGGGRDAASLGKIAASFLARQDGPRIAMLESSGWDTHNQQAGRLNWQFKGLDATLGALRDGLGDVWAKTTILVATEFGRTVSANGTGGTDHGTAAAAIVAGGAVRGGRVVVDWPGLAPANLYQNRDLRPTSAIDALISGVAGEALGIEPELILRTLFADTGTKSAMEGFFRG